MRKILFALCILAVACGDIDPTETETGILIVVKPAPSLSVSCSLREDGTTCECTMSECGKAAIEKAAEACWRLRNPIVVE